jgi:hypothetical protein
VGGQCGEEGGNLQVGWWKTYEKKTENNPGFFSVFNNGKAKSESNKKNEIGKKDVETEVEKEEYDAVQPVFMDIWRKETVQTKKGKNDFTVIPRTALYVREKDRFGNFRRVYITRNFDSRDAVTGAARDNYDGEFLDFDRKKGTYTDFPIENASSSGSTENTESNLKSSVLLAKKKAELSSRFLRIEDIPAWERGEEPAGSDPHVTSPEGCSLVLFDSVCLPHEVMETLEGERLVLAGWMHEAQQPVPQWFNMDS